MKAKLALWVFVAVLLVVLPLAVGCAPAAEEPSVAKPAVLTMHQFGPLTGPYATLQAGLLDGVGDAFKYINEEKGGIDGVPLKLTFEDTAGDLQKEIASYEKWIAMKPKPIFGWVYGSPTSEALRDRYIQDKVVVFAGSSTIKGMYPAGNLFSYAPSYTDGLGLFVDWLVETQPKPISLAFLNWDTAFGRTIMVDECRDYCKQKGVDIVAEEVFGMTQMDVTTQLKRIEQAGANWVYCQTLGASMSVILKSADALGLIGKMNFAGCPWILDRNSTIGLAGSLANGVYGVSFNRQWAETDNPYIQLVTERAKADGVYDKYYMHRLVNIGVWMYVKDIFEKAIAEVGWENLDAAALKKQLENTKNYDAGAVVFTYSPDKHETRDLRVMQIKEGEIVPVTNWKKAPDLRPYEFK